ncbi:MAG TPA: aquaporin [Terriglobia bacterium]|nr:aquaporin [Terriglobia bacterium]
MPAGNRRKRKSVRVYGRLFLSELIGTALLVAVGVSAVILDFGTGSPVATLLPDPGLRRLITGFLFGAIGGSIAVSPVGKISGAHINPAVTLSFWIKRKISRRHAAGYFLAQFAGGLLGALPLLAWGAMGASVHFGATSPGTGYTAWQAVLGEVITTFCLIVGIFLFIGHRLLRPYTPGLFPFLYAVMVYLEAPVSGTSTNPARSLGPSLVSANWQGWWVSWIGPLLGTLLALGILRLSPLKRFEVDIAKLYHFEHDPHGLYGLGRQG